MEALSWKPNGENGHSSIWSVTVWQMKFYHENGNKTSNDENGSHIVVRYDEKWMNERMQKVMANRIETNKVNLVNQ